MVSCQPPARRSKPMEGLGAKLLCPLLYAIIKEQIIDD